MDRNIVDANAYQLPTGLYIELLHAEHYSDILWHRFHHDILIRLKITIDMSEEWYDA